MRLPHTDNAEHLWAFKKGYRFARQGKSLREMPLTIRTDRTLRDYFQQGFEQAQQQLAAQSGPTLTPGKRALWLLLTIVAGLATAKLMIDEMQADTPAQTAQTEQPRKAQAHNKTGDQTNGPEHAADPSSAQTNTLTDTMAPAQATDTTAPAIPTDAPPLMPTTTADTQPAPPAPTPVSGADTKTSFALLDEEARAKQLQLKDTDALLPPVKPSDIQVARAVLAAGIENMEPVGQLHDVVPKSMRRVVFFTEIKGARGRTIIHRWRYGDRVMAEVRLPIGSDDFRTWSSKRMSAAWTGRWWVEVLDDTGQVIARKGFRYVR